MRLSFGIRARRAATAVVLAVPPAFAACGLSPLAPADDSSASGTSTTTTTSNVTSSAGGAGGTGGSGGATTTTSASTTASAGGGGAGGTGGSGGTGGATTSSTTSSAGGSGGSGGAGGSTGGAGGGGGGTGGSTGSTTSMTSNAGGAGGAGGSGAAGGSGGSGGEGASMDGGAPDGGDPGDGGVCGAVVTTVPVVPSPHVASCSPVTYGTNPPTSGPHYPVWAAFKVYTTPVPRGFYVHSMEHGAVVVQYNCPSGCDADVAALVAYLESRPPDPLCTAPLANRFVVTPDPLLDVPFAASAWGAHLEMQCLDLAAIGAFIDAYYAKGPENFCFDGTDVTAPGSGFPADCGSPPDGGTD